MNEAGTVCFTVLYRRSRNRVPTERPGPWGAQQAGRFLEPLLDIEVGDARPRFLTLHLVNYVANKLCSGLQLAYGLALASLCVGHPAWAYGP